MGLYVNLILAWVTVGLGILCSIIWVLRWMHTKRCSGQKNGLYRVNRALRRSHKWLGIAMIVTGCIHGILSSDPLLGWNLGTLCWVICFLLGLTYLFRKGSRRVSWMAWHRVLTIALICLATAHVIHTGIQIDDVLWKENGEIDEIIDDFNRATEEPALDTEKDADTQPAVSPAAAGWRDGVYIGEGTGFRPGLRVQVTIEDGMITGVEVIQHNEKSERYWGLPVSLIPERILDAQSTDVDIVTGATMTSRGVMEAAQDALAQASE